YKKWIRTKPCLKCWSITGVVAHHENKKGHGSMGSKCSDLRCLPLCSGNCHSSFQGSRHETSREEFWGDIDVEAIILEYNREWEELQKT
ncbi:MAG: DUF968 domain-containing protein, partial [PVC group bacterium]|nr:DUF968 domain-containing protein [PVC group bacterium]